MSGDAGRPALLEIEGLTASYGPVRALHGVDLAVGEGQVVALLGPNGAGKTTTLRAVCGMVRTGGRITLGGRELTGLSTEKVVRLGRRARARGPRHLRRPHRRGEPAARRRTAGATAPRCGPMWTPGTRSSRGWPSAAGQAAGSLSGGEQQMLAIARALLSRPSLLLLDEPSLGLAPRVTRELFAVLGRVKAEQGTSMLLVEQNATLALELADTAYVLEAGRTVLSGPAADVRADESVRRVYLGY